MIVGMNILSSIIIGLSIVYGNIQSITGNGVINTCLNPNISNSQIPKCCGPFDYKGWIVSIIEKNFDCYVGIGVILHKRAVLALADQITNVDAKDVVVTDAAKNRDHPVSRIIQQPRTRSSPLFERFAILLLSSPIEFIYHVNNICWTDLSVYSRQEAKIYKSYFFLHQESFQKSLHINPYNQFRNERVISNRTIHMVLGEKTIKNEPIYYFIGFEIKVHFKYLKHHIKSYQTHSQYLSPNFQWINKVLQENLHETVIGKKDKNTKRLKFKLHVSKNNTSLKYNIKITDIESDIKSGQFNISATQV